MREQVYTVLFPFCGIGGGALGFQSASVTMQRLGLSARFRVLGGIEWNEGTARDFERLTGAPCLVHDVTSLTPALLREWFGLDAPDVVFFSPPCKGACGLLSGKIACTPKYVAMNELPVIWTELMFAAWPEGPRLTLMENVPRIRTRAASTMRQVRDLHRARGYITHDAAHNLGKIGGLAQSRPRLLFVARRAESVPALLHQPMERKLRSVGEVLGALPLPGDPAAGPLHALPALDAITALRLALIPAGGDWRDLPAQVHLPTELAAAVAKRKAHPSTRTPFDDVYRVIRWDDPSPCVTAGAAPSAGGLSIADPRGVRACGARSGDHGVLPWSEPSGTITGQTRPSNGALSVADPRPATQSHPHTYGVLPWNGAAHTITGNTVPGGGPFSVADPRLTCKTRENSGIYGVIPWTEPSGTIVAHACHDNGRFSVADPRWPASVPFPVILSTDGTWHRPLTLLERAALQSLPTTLDGGPLTLTGRSKGDWSVRIGDCVPPAAAREVATQMLLTLLQADASAFSLSSGGAVWVERREHEGALQ